MSYALACARADTFRAVAVYSAALLSGCEGGTEPIAYFAIRGVQEPVGIGRISDGPGPLDPKTRSANYPIPGRGLAGALSPVGDYLFVALLGTNGVDVLDTFKRNSADRTSSTA